MSKNSLLLVAILAAFLLGATAIDKNDEQSCKDRWVAYIDATSDDDGSLPGAPSQTCGGLLPW